MCAGSKCIQTTSHKNGTNLNIWNLMTLQHVPFVEITNYTLTGHKINFFFFAALYHVARHTHTHIYRIKWIDSRIIFINERFRGRLITNANSLRNSIPFQSRCECEKHSKFAWYRFVLSPSLSRIPYANIK